MDARQYPRNEALEAAVSAEPYNDAPRLVYADWLEDNGDPQRATYIRARCALDDRPPPDDHVALWEQRLEVEKALSWRPFPALPAPFVVSRNSGDDWWQDRWDGLERGFPSLARINGTPAAASA